MQNDVLRVSDAERDHVVALLQEHHGRGRLDLEELHQRVTDAYAATTRGDLRRLTSDLPGPASLAPVLRRTPTRENPRSRVRLVPLVIVVAVLTGCLVPFAYLGILPLAAAGVLVAYRHDTGRWPRWLVAASGSRPGEAAHHTIAR